MPEHNEAIAGDSLFSIELNHKWRRIIAGVLSHYFRQDDSTISLDNEDLLSALLLDLYNAEALNVGVKTTALNIQLDTSKTTTSTSFVIMPVSGFYHTPTKPNVRITCSNITLLNSGVNLVEAQIRVAGAVGTSSAHAMVTDSSGRQTRASALFTGLAIGVSVEIDLYWRVGGGTGTCNRVTAFTWEIEEYD